MKLITYLLLATIFIVAQEQDSTKAAMNEQMILGTCNINDIASGFHQEWYSAEYDNYDVDTSALEPIRDLLQEVEIVLVFGTWCSDSRREVPRFLKILATLDYPDDSLTMLGVDRERIIDPETGYDFDIERVPTFIFLIQGMELGRIVESPEVSLESDMTALLLGY